MSVTFDPASLCWFDFETRSGEDLQTAGATRYACDPAAAAIILTYALGRGATRIATANGAPLVWESFPADFRGHYHSGGMFAAFNAGFDKAIWNYTVPGAPPLPANRIIDPAAQAAAAGLPPDLAGACKASGSTAKVVDGKKYIKLFCLPGSTATPMSHPKEWVEFGAYAIGDIDAMRSLFLRTRQLPLREWEEYWAMEAINDRGVRVDTDFARKADALAKVARTRGGQELRELTGGCVTGVGQIKNLTNWLCDKLPPEGIHMLKKREEEEDDDGTVIRPAKYSLTRPRVEKLIPYCQTIGHAAELRALEIRLYGGSTTPAKYGRILAQEVRGSIFGQYVFNGAPQTGRASSRGVQVQNLTRAYLPYEHEAIEAILNGADYDDLAAVGDDTPVLRKLALLIRPTFVPADGNLFVVSDFSQVEARVLPWLAGAKSEGALKRLKIFSDIDADPSLPDLYTRTAADMSGLGVAKITKPLRQRGKVAELALGFGGGIGALAAMGAAYGLYLPEDEAKAVVGGWRRANPWCVHFWGKHDTDTSYGLWGAANRALERPHSTQYAGRLAYTFVPEVNRGTLFCQLPSGRCIAYRGIRFENVDILDDDDVKIGERVELRFWKGHNRAHIWHGTLCENVVQATAADLLRGTLVRLQGMASVRLHSHDEILVEVAEADADLAAGMLRRVMQQGFDWSEGLPLMSEETVQPYYSKWESQ